MYIDVLNDCYTIFLTVNVYDKITFAVFTKMYVRSCRKELINYYFNIHKPRLY